MWPLNVFCFIFFFNGNSSLIYTHNDKSQLQHLLLARARIFCTIGIYIVSNELGKYLYVLICLEIQTICKLQLKILIRKYVSKTNYIHTYRKYIKKKKF